MTFLMISPFSTLLLDHIPQLYHRGTRRSLTLKFFTNGRRTITDETALQLLQLVDDGVDLEISNLVEGGDFLKDFRNRMHKQSL